MLNTQVQAPAQPCEACQQKPRFSGSKYCSRYCASSAGAAIPATQAAPAPASASANATGLCNYCQSKPKHANFEYCGKYCASQAASGAAPAAAQATAQPASQGFNPAQMAQALAQQFPSMQTYFATVNPQGQIVPSTNGTTATTAAATAAPAQPPAPVNTTCLIPGCGKPVHVDAKGAKTSDYCSKRHREEAVTSGLAEACIMCRKYPQGDKDYFCSRTCKEEATKKSGQ